MEMFAPLVREWERKKERSAAMTFTLHSHILQTPNEKYH
jgi:hypothetical protein|tara:strand:+ start:1124 stop:1240 length:117 start_codon:yes stop_codon:yes gene_type:complete